MTGAGDVDDRLAELLADVADDYRARRERGEDPDPEEYAARHPAAAGAIRRVLGRFRPAAAGPAAPDPTADYPGRPARAGAVIAGKYTLVEPVGAGGMGSVWRARQTDPVRRYVAVKLVRPGMDSRQVLARFEAERQALALMDHPNIAKVLDGGIHGGRPFFVMELVKGVPITDFCDARRLTPRERLELFVPVCQAIQHAHQKGVIHRDIKPSNVLVALYDDRPVPKVIDFGVAKATGAALTEKTIDTGFGGVVGTPAYMSPEQATLNNLDIDTRSDVYALGVLLYELLAGSPPFSRAELEKKGLLEVLRVVREEDPPRPSQKLSTAEALPTLSANRGTEPRKLTGLLRSELDWVVMRALEKDRARRYETAAAFAADVQRYLAGEAVQAHPPGAAYRLRKFARRNRPQVVAAGLVLLALAGGAAGAAAGLVRATRAVDEERQARVREAERAEGERAAKEEAERNLAFAKKGNEILGSVFAGLHPERIAESGRPLQDVLRENLGKAVAELEGSAVGDPLEVAAMQNTLGLSLLGLGEYGPAAEVLRKPLHTRAARLGPDHPDTLRSLGNLAHAYLVGGRPDRAVPLLEEALAKAKAALGPDHPVTLASMNNLAEAYRASGQIARALALLEVVLAKAKAALGPDHPDTLTGMHNLALAYRASRQVAQALPLLEEALAKQRATLGPGHPHTLVSMNNLATAYRDGGRPDRAVPLLEEALAKQKAALGPDHPGTLTSMGNLGATYARAGQGEQAAATLVAFVAAQRKQLPAGGPEFAGLLAQVSFDLLGCGQPAAAEPLLRECLAIREKAQPDAWTTFNTHSLLGGALAGQKKYAEAEPLLLRGYAGMKARETTIPPPGAARIPEALDRLAGLYAATGRPAEAAKWRAERAKYPPERAPPPRATE